jgi:hypothetical protein
MPNKIAESQNEVAQERHSRIMLEQKVRALEAPVNALRREIQEKEELASITHDSMMKDSHK